MLKKVLRKIKHKLKNIFSIKIPVKNPILYGELLKGRCALITGGTSGIGFAIAEAFLRNKADVVITGRNQLKIDTAVNNLKKAFPEQKISGVLLDNCNISKMKDSFQNVLLLEQEKKIDILVNNAGVINKTFFGNTLENDFDLVIATDLKGPYFLSELFANYLKENKIEGNILNVSSSSAIRPASNSYGLAKWGLRGMTLGLAKHLSGYGIVVNAIAPGPTATTMLLNDNEKSISRPSSPSERYATPEEIANMSVVLVSDLGRMINGDTVYITGGCGLLTFDDWS